MTPKQIISALIGWLAILTLVAIAMIIPAMIMWAIGFPVPPSAVYLAIVYSAVMLAKEIWRSNA